MAAPWLGSGVWDDRANEAANARPPGEIITRVAARAAHVECRGGGKARGFDNTDDVPVPSVPSVPPARHLLRARDLADRRYAESVTVADMARAAQLSPAHFSREFRRTFGESPHQYLLTRRLERAATLLRTTDWSVARICLAVGTTEPGDVHDELPHALRPDADRVPGHGQAGGGDGRGPDVCDPRLRAAAIPHDSRRRRRSPINRFDTEARNPSRSDSQERT